MDSFTHASVFIYLLIYIYSTYLFYERLPPINLIAFRFVLLSMSDANLLEIKM